MKKTRSLWTLGLGAVLLVIIIPLAVFWPKPAQAKDNPWDNVPRHTTHTDHKDIVKGEFTTGQQVTRACLECHQIPPHR